MTRRLIAAIGAGLSVRILLIAGAWTRRGVDAFLVPDSSSYLGLAERLTAGLGFVDRTGKAELFRTPGYPLLLAAGSTHPVVVALVSQLLMTAGIVVLTFLLARRMLDDDRIAVVCAFVVALEPTMLTWSLKVMPETLLTLALVAFAYAALRAFDTRETRWIVAAAFALSLAAYVKPIAWPLVILLCALSLLRWRMAAIFILTCALLLVPWHVRNARRAGYPGFSTLIARAAYISAGGSILAQREHRPYAEIHEELVDRAGVRHSEGDPSQYGRQGLTLLASDPLGYTKTHVKGMLRTLFDPGATEYLRLFRLYGDGPPPSFAAQGIGGVARQYPLAFWLSVGLAVVLAPLVLLPVVGLWRGRSVGYLLLAVVVAYLITAGGGVPGYSRFRAPAVPLLVVMSAVVVDELRRRTFTPGLTTESQRAQRRTEKIKGNDF